MFRGGRTRSPDKLSRQSECSACIFQTPCPAFLLSQCQKPDAHMQMPDNSYRSMRERFDAWLLSRLVNKKCRWRQTHSPTRESGTPPEFLRGRLPRGSRTSLRSSLKVENKPWR
jgi:hypothetical protein